MITIEYGAYKPVHQYTKPNIIAMYSNLILLKFRNIKYNVL